MPLFSHDEDAWWEAKTKQEYVNEKTWDMMIDGMVRPALQLIEDSDFAAYENLGDLVQDETSKCEGVLRAGLAQPGGISSAHLSAVTDRSVASASAVDCMTTYVFSLRTIVITTRVHSSNICVWESGRVGPRGGRLQKKHKLCLANGWILSKRRCILEEESAETCIVFETGVPGGTGVGVLGRPAMAPIFTKLLGAAGCPGEVADELRSELSGAGSGAFVQLLGQHMARQDQRFQNMMATEAARIVEELPSDE